MIVTQEQRELMKRLNSTFKLLRNNNRHECQLIDITTRRPWASGTGVEREAALADALANAPKGDRTPTPRAELEVKTQSQAEKIAELEAEIAKLKPAETRKRRRAARTTTKTETNEAQDTGTAALDTSEG